MQKGHSAAVALILVMVGKLVDGGISSAFFG